MRRSYLRGAVKQELEDGVVGVEGEHLTALLAHQLARRRPQSAEVEAHLANAKVHLREEERDKPVQSFKTHAFALGMARSVP